MRQRDAAFHRRRARQERTIAEAVAGSREARIHLELARLHDERASSHGGSVTPASGDG